MSDDDDQVIVGPSLAISNIRSGGSTNRLSWVSSYSLTRHLLLETSHHLDELLELDLTVTILVDLFDNGVDSLNAKSIRATEAENLADLISGDNTRAILVEHAEGGVQLLLRGQAALASGGNHEFGVVDEAAVISVDSTEHLLNLLVGHDSSVVFQVALFNFVHGKLAVSVLIEGSEDLGKVVTFLLAHELRCDESVSGLLEGNVRLEFAEVIKGIDSERLVNLKGGELGQPRVLKSLLS